VVAEFAAKRSKEAKPKTTPKNQVCDVAGSNEIGRSVRCTPPNLLEQATHPSLRSPLTGDSAIPS